MRITHRSIGAAAALAALASALPARAEPLAVKTGLWEVSSAGGGGAKMAMPPIPADKLAKLTPEQQALVQQKMAAISGGGAAPVVRKVCLTQAMLDKGFPNAGTQRNCTNTPVSSSASSMEVSIVCTGDHAATGSLRLQAADATTVTGTIDMTVTTKDGNSFPIHRTIQSKWLAADCGDVKPATN